MSTHYGGAEHQRDGWRRRSSYPDDRSAKSRAWIARARASSAAQSSGDTMTRAVRFAVVASLVLAAVPARAQHGAEQQALNTTPPAEAKQFNFLIGQWELDVEAGGMSSLAAAIHGRPKFVGTWKAWSALDGWGVEDELRISDTNGNPRGIGHTVRVYDATQKRWVNSNLDVYRAQFAASTSEQRQGSSGLEMVTLGRGVDPNGTTFVTRTRFYEIKPNGFRADSERSTDDGKTWSLLRRIVAKRVAAVAPR